MFFRINFSHFFALFKIISIELTIAFLFCIYLISNILNDKKRNYEINF